MRKLSYVNAEEEDNLGRVQFIKDLVSRIAEAMGDIEAICD